MYAVYAAGPNARTVLSISAAASPINATPNALGGSLGLFAEGPR
ncbi:MAG TPA: hypothetical protein VIW24_00430 [Aldersonia sp.]